jgi:hypothetical protein
MRSRSLPVTPGRASATGPATREYRILAFGGWGTVVYVIGERTAAVLILDLLWAG